MDAAAVDFNNTNFNALIILAASGFVTAVTFSIYDCISKVLQPRSTVHFTRLSGILLLSMCGIFLLCISNSSEVNQAQTSTFVVVTNEIAWSAVVGGTAAFLILASNPILGRHWLQILIQDWASIISVLGILQFFILVYWFIDDKEGWLIMSYVQLSLKAASLIMTGGYLWLFRRRLKHKLRSERGNERSLCWNGVGVVVMYAGALLVDVYAQSSKLWPSLGFNTEIYFHLILASRSMMIVMTLFMISMKHAYNRGLMTRLNGKVVFSRGYSATDENEIEQLINVEKPKTGIGAIA
jgi:hypothetical protein